MAALAVVSGDGDSPKPRRKSAAPVTIKAAAAKSRRDLLVALRDKIAGDLDDGVPARELASLSKRLVDIAEEIAQIDADKKGDDVGDAAATPDEPF